nr:notchless protein homolog [Tanacetum cinerariifolium]
GHGHWVNSLALSTEYVLRTGAFDYTHKHYSSPDEMKEAALERYNKMKGNAPERLVSGSDDFTMFLWEPSLVNHVYFSPDGQWIASASFDKSVKLWNGITGKFVCAFRGHVGPVYQISWSADSRLLLSGSKDSTLKVWDIRTQKLKQDLPGHEDEVFAVDWSPDGEKVASGDIKYKQYISFSADQLPITKISYVVNTNKEATMKITRGDNPLNLVVHPNFWLKSLGISKWMEAKKLRLPPPPALVTVGIIVEENKRKRTQFLKEAFVTEDVKVDGMNKNLIPPPEVVSIEGLVIKEPESRIFFINRNTNIDFQREKIRLSIKEHLSGRLRGNKRTSEWWTQSFREQRQTYLSQRHRQGSRRLLEDILVSWDGYQLTEHEAKKANMIEEYKQHISFRVDQLPITKINYVFNPNKEATMKIFRGDNPLNLVIHPNFRLMSLGFSEWIEAKKLRLPPPPALVTFGITTEEKKRKRTQFLKESFVTEDIRVDGMNKNLIPPPEVVPIEDLVIKEPKSRIFFINRNTDIAFQRES